MSVRGLLGLVIALGAVLLAGQYLSERSQNTVAPDPREALGRRATFVGGTSCASCHEDQTALWSSSHHDLAMQVADDTTVLGDFENSTFTYAGTTSTFFRRDAEYMVLTDGADGELHDYAISYTFGVDPLQQYLIEFPDGRLQALSIAWDTRSQADGGQRWFHLYPDEEVDHEDVLHWSGLAQNWNFMCAECHSTDLQKRYTLDTDSYETTWSDIDVSCEACHGPGSEHVRWAEAVERGETPDDTSTPDGIRTRDDVELKGLVVDLADRDQAVWNIDAVTGLATRSVARTSRTKLELCARCHSRRSVVSADYVYGRPLVETHRPSLLDDGLYHHDGQIRDEVYVYGSFLQSKMYEAGVTCSECHDSHTLTVRGEGNARCAGCHEPAVFDSPEHHFHETGTPGASCVECHMPATTYMMVDPRRDHSFRSPRPDLSVTLGTPNACNACHTDRSPQWAADAVGRSYGLARPSEQTLERPVHYGETLAAARRGAPGAADALAALVLDTQVPGIVRATAVAELRGYPGTIAASTIKQTVGSDDPLIRAAGVTAAEALGPDARLQLLGPLLNDPARLVRTEAARVLAGVPDTLFAEAQRSTLARALDEYRAVQHTNADRAESHVNLGLLHAQRNEPEAAEVSYEQALALNPSFVPAYANLADLHRAQGRDDVVETVLEQGLDAIPSSGDLHHAMGLLRVRQQRRPEALESLGRAAELMPEMARYSYVFGVALNSTGQGSRALDVLNVAHQRHPGDREILLALATISRDRGALEAARDFARRLQTLEPTNPQIAQLLAQIEGERR